MYISEGPNKTHPSNKKNLEKKHKHFAKSDHLQRFMLQNNLLEVLQKLRCLPCWKAGRQHTHAGHHSTQNAHRPDTQALYIVTFIIGL